jgi:hypothetical protein
MLHEQSGVAARALAPASDDPIKTAASKIDRTRAIRSPSLNASDTSFLRRVEPILLNLTKASGRLSGFATG